MKTKVHVVDAIMGAGKTSAAINYINSSPSDKHFVYVTPYLAEVERVMAACQEKDFRTPKGYVAGKRGGTKLSSFKWLLDHKKNIVTTHALFRRFDDEIICLLQNNRYELIMDEVTSVFNAYNITNKDLENLLEKYVYVDDNDFLHWRESEADYTGKFFGEKQIIDDHRLVLYKKRFMYWFFPVKIFESFEQVFILTYMFKSQIQSYYYKYYGVKYDYLGVASDGNGDYSFTWDGNTSSPKVDYKKLITIVNDRKLNHVGEGRYALSAKWYHINKNNGCFEEVRKNMENFFHNKKTVLTADGEWRKCKGSEALWTVFIADNYDNMRSHNLSSQYKKRIAKGSGVAKSFVACNTRATNDYGDRVAIAYLVNRFIQPNVKNFFSSHGIKIYEDEYALAEMLQFIWRSAIRNGQHISIYIPSERMRTLLKNWIEENSASDYA